MHMSLSMMVNYGDKSDYKIPTLPIASLKHAHVAVNDG